MKYADLNLELLKGHRHLLIVGPQRSGTTIAARIFAAELNRRYVDERTVGVRSYTQLYERLLSKEPSVIQGPCFSSNVHWIDAPNTFVIYMMRNIAEIVKSQNKIDWPEATTELHNYFTSSGEISEVRYNAWNQYQKSMMKVPWLELEYDSLQTHSMWISDRSKFARRQWGSHGPE